MFIITREDNKSQEEIKYRKILSDKTSAGKERPWGEYKMQNMLLADSYARLAGWSFEEHARRREGVRAVFDSSYYERRKEAKRVEYEMLKRSGGALFDLDGELCEIDEEMEKQINWLAYETFNNSSMGARRSKRVRYCGYRLSFKVLDKGTGRKKLKRAYFCKDRLCPLCQWRRSMRIFTDMSKIMNVLEEERPNLVPVFFTLTIKNVVGEELSGAVDRLMNGWKLLLNQRNVKRIIKGYFRTLEVTFKKEIDDYHPHMHALFMVDEEYFTSGEYIDQDGWTELCRRSLKLDYNPIIDIRRLNETEGRGELMEVSKSQIKRSAAKTASYACKEIDISSDDPVVTDRLVKTLSGSLYNRRLSSFGGVMKEVASRLKIDLENGDLVNIDDSNLCSEVVEMIEVYKWNIGIKNYECVKIIGGGSDESDGGGVELFEADDIVDEEEIVAALLSDESFCKDDVALEDSRESYYEYLLRRGVRYPFDDERQSRDIALVSGGDDIEYNDKVALSSCNAEGMFEEEYEMDFRSARIDCFDEIGEGVFCVDRTRKRRRC